MRSAPARARRQDRGRRCLYERHDGAGRPARADPTGHRRRARLCRDALPVPRWPRRLGLSRPLYRRAARACRARAHPYAGMGSEDYRLFDATIEQFARLVGETKRAFFRLGYGFSRSRNGAANMHAASCIPAVTGAWLTKGRRLPQQPRDLSLGQDHDRRARCPRPVDPHARSVAHRRGAHRGGRKRSAAARP